MREFVVLALISASAILGGAGPGVDPDSSPSTAINQEKLDSFKTLLAFIFHPSDTFEEKTIDKVLDDLKFDKELKTLFFENYTPNETIVTFVHETFDSAVQNKIIAKTLSRMEGDVFQKFAVGDDSGDVYFADYNCKNEWIPLHDTKHWVKYVWHFGYVLNALTKYFGEDCVFDTHTHTPNHNYEQCSLILSKFNPGKNKFFEKYMGTFQELEQGLSECGTLYDIAIHAKYSMIVNAMQSFTMTALQIRAQCDSKDLECVCDVHSRNNNPDRLLENIMWAVESEMFYSNPMHMQNPKMGFELIKYFQYDSVKELAVRDPMTYGLTEGIEKTFREDWLDLYTAWNMQFLFRHQPHPGAIQTAVLFKLFMPEQGGYRNNYNSGLYFERRSFSLATFVTFHLASNRNAKPKPFVQFSKEFGSILQKETDIAMKELKKSAKKDQSIMNAVTAFEDVNRDMINAAKSAIDAYFTPLTPAPVLSSETLSIMQGASPNLRIDQLYGTWKMHDHFAIDQFAITPINHLPVMEKRAKALQFPHAITRFLPKDVSVTGIAEVKAKTLVWKDEAKPFWTVPVDDDDGYLVVLHSNGILRFIPFQKSTIVVRLVLAKLDSKDGSLLDICWNLKHAKEFGCFCFAIVGECDKGDDLCDGRDQGQLMIRRYNQWGDEQPTYIYTALKYSKKIKDLDLDL